MGRIMGRESCAIALARGSLRKAGVILEIERRETMLHDLRGRRILPATGADFDEARRRGKAFIIKVKN